MWLLSTVLPFILAEFVDTTSDQWRCLISIIELMSLCLAHKISLTTIVYLKRAIKEHLQLFKSLYGNMCNIIPKQHYLIHLPSLIFKFGPLVRSWCMRFEGKHAYFKDQAKISRTYHCPCQGDISFHYALTILMLVKKTMVPSLEKKWHLVQPRYY